ncbi:hypothetical protein HU200_055333 [Digitaria exilis]|uniref:Uncharacterized protein n=1 Tax=Digitaria exilis TaxID=1010633 RepID=A0A835AHA9_9POAL|nr:hypothetical protein HU200_055333 [Digitaria exilis]
MQRALHGEGNGPSLPDYLVCDHVSRLHALFPSPPISWCEFVGAMLAGGSSSSVSTSPCTATACAPGSSKEEATPTPLSSIHPREEAQASHLAERAKGRGNEKMAKHPPR